ncbi:hypothetical protein [Pseudoclavibacter helvolus]
MTIWHYLAVAVALIGAAVAFSTLPIVAGLNVVAAALVIIGSTRKERKR